MITASQIRNPTSPSTSPLFEARVCSSNNILSEHDQVVVRKMLVEAHREIASLEMDIARQEEALSHLKEHRSLKMERVERLRTGIAPQKKLSPEILAKIFVESADYEGICIPPDIVHSVTRTLGLVCSRWREISRAEPELWSYIEVTDLSSENTISLVSDILSHRGGQGRVEISLHPRDDNEWTTTLNFVEKYSSRLRSLCLLLDKSCLAPLATPLKVFDEVQSLSLTFRGSEAILGSAISAFSNARDLRKLSLRLLSYPNFTDLTGNMIPWGRLTDVTLIHACGPSAMAIVSRCSSLINLTVMLPDLNVSPSTSAVLFPHLQSIHISARSCLEDITEVLKHLTLPSLRKITLGILRGAVMSRLPIVEVIEHSACHVESFQMNSIVLSAADLIPMLRLMPALTMWDVRIDRPILDSVFSTIMAEKLAPNLCVLQGWGVSSVHPVMNFLNSRWLRTASGSYEGIRDSVIWTHGYNYCDADKRYIQSLVPEMKRQGRNIRFTSYQLC